MKAYHVAFFYIFLSLFCLSIYFLSLSHKTDKPSPPPEYAGHDAPGEEESLCCSLKDSSGSLSLLETAIILLHRPLERHPTDPHGFFCGYL